jgi:serine/threonine protein kinase
MTGRRPFPKPTLIELLTAHKKEDPEPIEHFRQDVPPDLTDIIECMIAKSPNQRFQTAKEVAEKLKAWLADSAGREYSRISALMAAAMRAKPSATSDSAAKKSSAGESTDLQLAALEDEPRRSAAAKSAPGAAVESPKPAKSAPGGGRLTSESGRLAAGKQATDRPKRPSSPGSSTRSLQGDTKRSLSPSPSRSDVLAEFLVENLPPSGSSVAMAASPAESGSHPSLSHIKRQRSASVLGLSAWFWTAAAWVVFVALLLLLLIYVASRDKPSTVGADFPRIHSSSPAEKLWPAEKPSSKPAE